MRIILSLGFIILCYGLAPLSEAQQQSFGNRITEASMILDPAYPEPGEEVVLSLNIYAFDTIGSTITWLVDGEVVPQTIDKKELTLTAPALGGATELEARVRLRGGQVIPVKHKLTSGYLDIVVEALTHVPTFYLGRPLSSAGSQLRITAIPFLGEDPAGLTYTWKLNNKVLFGGPVHGRQTINLTAPSASGLLTVDVSSRLGATVGRRTVEISPTPVKINFYEDNPLRGQTKLAVPKKYTLVGSEVTLSAEPYYANTGDPNVLEEWRLDGKTIDDVGLNTRNITLTARAGGGVGQLSYLFQSLSEFTQRASKEITILFNQTL